MYNSNVIVLWIPEIEEFNIFWVMVESSEDTAWKKSVIWSELTNSGKAAGIDDTKFKNSLNNLGISRTNDWSCVYIRGINQTKIAAPTRTNNEKAIKVAK